MVVISLPVCLIDCLFGVNDNHSPRTSQIAYKDMLNSTNKYGCQ